MLLIFVLLAFLFSNILAVAIPTSYGALSATGTGKAPMITDSPSILGVQDLTAISANIQSLIDPPRPLANLTYELSSSLTSIIATLKVPNIISAFGQLNSDRNFTNFTTWPSASESWAFDLTSTPTTILPHVISLKSLINDIECISSSTLRVAPHTDGFLPTVRSPVVNAIASATATSVIKKRGVGQGQLIGIIIGIAIFCTASMTAGFMYYDALSRRAVATAARAAHEQRIRDNPPRTYVPSRRSQQWSSRQSQVSRASQESITELRGEVASGAGAGAAHTKSDSVEIQPAPPAESYEMHTLGIRSS